MDGWKGQKNFRLLFLLFLFRLFLLLHLSHRRMWFSLFEVFAYIKGVEWMQVNCKTFLFTQSKKTYTIQCEIFVLFAKPFPIDLCKCNFPNTNNLSIKRTNRSFSQSNTNKHDNSYQMQFKANVGIVWLSRVCVCVCYYLPLYV